MSSYLNKVLCSFFILGAQDEAQISQSGGTGADLYCSEPYDARQTVSEMPSRNFSTLDSESRFFLNDYTVITCFLESRITCIIH